MCTIIYCYQNLKPESIAVVQQLLLEVFKLERIVKGYHDMCQIVCLLVG